MQNAVATPTGGQVPELGHLKAAAERIAQANYNLRTFFNRFNGPQPETADAGGQAEQPPSYRNDINAIFSEIGELETLVGNLSSIG